MGAYIPAMELPPFGGADKNGESRYMAELTQHADGTASLTVHFENEKKKRFPILNIPPHGDLIDREQFVIGLCLDESIEVMARTKIINEYMAGRIEDEPAIIGAEG